MNSISSPDLRPVSLLYGENTNNKKIMMILDLFFIYLFALLILVFQIHL